MSKKTKTIISVIAGMIIVLGIASFFVTSWALSIQHGLTIVQEWQSWSWFGLNKQVVEQGKEVVETGLRMMI